MGAGFCHQLSSMLIESKSDEALRELMNEVNWINRSEPGEVAVTWFAYSFVISNLASIWL
jgi:hypothetical protein